MQDRSRSPLSREALRYTWRQLAHRAGVTGGDPFGTGLENLKIPVYYENALQVQPDRSSIIVVPCADSAWWALLERAPCSLQWVSVRETVPQGVQLPIGDSIPVLFWGEGYDDGSKPFAELRDDGSVVFYADLIASTFFMLSRWEETVVDVRDEHDRFPGTASVAHKQAFLDRPVVDLYAQILRCWLRTLLPQWVPEVREFSVKLSHDVDAIRRFPTLYSATQSLGADLLKRHSLRKAWETVVDTFWQTGAPHRTAHYQGIDFLAGLSKRHKIDSAFYFMATEPGPLESDYDLASPLIRQCIERLQKQGFEIGLHPGYHTFNDQSRLAAEKARLDEALGETKYGGRQHFLRFHVPQTWRNWEEVGLTYDSTMTYPEHEGFRCGTCHPFRPFDVQQIRQLSIWEIPLIVMDVTLCKYRKFSPEQAEARILELAQRCKQVEGTFTLLWHNSSLDSTWRAWPQMYERVVEELSELQQGH